VGLTTTARYYTPSGLHAIQADGIHPDVVIESGNFAARPRRH
jgi:C-terminal processing protease CtpA/Prc